MATYDTSALTSLSPDMLAAASAAMHAAVDAQSQIAKWISDAEGGILTSHLEAGKIDQAKAVRDSLPMQIANLQTYWPRTPDDQNAKRWLANPKVATDWLGSVQQIATNVAAFIDDTALPQAIQTAVSVWNATTKKVQDVSLAIVQDLNTPIPKDKLQAFQDAWDAAGASLQTQRQLLVKLGLARLKSGQTLTADEVAIYNKNRRDVAVSISELVTQMNAAADAYNQFLKSLPIIGALATQKPSQVQLFDPNLGDKVLDQFPLLPREILPPGTASTSAPSLTDADKALTAGRSSAGAGAVAIGVLVIVALGMTALVGYIWGPVLDKSVGAAKLKQAETDQQNAYVANTLKIQAANDASNTSYAARLTPLVNAFIAKGKSPEEATKLAQQALGPPPTPLAQLDPPKSPTDWIDVAKKVGIGAGVLFGASLLLGGREKTVALRLAGIPKKTRAKAKTPKFEACVRKVAKKGRAEGLSRRDAKSKAYAICNVSVRHTPVRNPGGFPWTT